MRGSAFRVRPLVAAVRQLPHPLRGLLTIYALWNVVAGVPVFFDLGIGLNLLMIVSGGLACLDGFTVVLDVSGAAMSLAVQLEGLHAAARGRPRRRLPTRLRARSEGLFAVAVGAALVVSGLHAQS